MHSSPFSAAGMSSSTSSHHSPNLNTLNAWGTPNTGGAPFGDSLSQPRSHYQSGYLLSTSQSNNIPPGSPRMDEVPIVQTKAKMNHILSRGSATEFGMDSMFQNSRHRQTFVDEDAPPMTSVNEIPNETNFDSSPHNFQLKKSTIKSSFSSRRDDPLGPSTQHPSYVIVFGYPTDKYSVTVEYFKSLGNATEADPHLEIANCFKIGYYDPGEAMRAVRKNGEVLGGSFMVGVKWADPSQAEVLYSSSFGRSTIGSPISGPTSNFSQSRRVESMAVDEPFPTKSNGHSSSNTPSVGTPIRLAPSTSAFKQSNLGSVPTNRGSAPQNLSGIAPTFSSISTSPATQPPPSKGLVGQAVDMIFGW